MMKGMINMKNYLIKKASVFGNFSNNYKKPSVCSHCGFGTDAPFYKKDVYSFNGHYLFVATCTCTSCGKHFLFFCEYDSDKNDYEPVIYPSITFAPYSNKILEKISARFIDMYNQALQSEFNKNLELAAIGYRSALEILVKDYAIKELGQNPKEVISKKLCPAIGAYLNQEDLVKTADVVRILGNDYTHYERKYPQHDFELLKGYMEIFLKQIEVQYMIKHPPVSRTP